MKVCLFSCHIIFCYIMLFVIYDFHTKNIINTCAMMTLTNIPNG